MGEMREERRRERRNVISLNKVRIRRAEDAIPKIGDEERRGRSRVGINLGHHS